MKNFARLTALASALLSLTVIAQTPPATPPAPAPSAPAPAAAKDVPNASGLKPAEAAALTPPNISGIWRASLRPALADNPPMLTKTREIWKGMSGDDDPLIPCKPPGVPRINNQAFPFEIIQNPHNPNVIYILYEYDQATRRIYMNGTPPKDPDPTWYGYSTGRWEGKSLVIETTGQNDIGWLDMRGHLRSESTKVIERYTIADDGMSLKNEVTIEDAALYASPWQSVPRTHGRLANDTKITEFICETEDAHYEQAAKEAAKPAAAKPTAKLPAAKTPPKK